METALGPGTGTELFSYSPGSDDTAISVKEKTAVEVSKRLGSGSAAGGRGSMKTAVLRDELEDDEAGFENAKTAVPGEGR